MTQDLLFSSGQQEDVPEQEETHGIFQRKKQKEAVLEDVGQNVDLYSCIMYIVYCQL